MPRGESFSQAFEAVIGLEVHAQLTTRTKAFCSCKNAFGARPNTLVCPVCLGLPGALPNLNREAVVMAVRAAMALRCTVHQRSAFARKHYFYPDLPKGYQITQYDRPLATGGALYIRTTSPDGRSNGRRRVGIQRLHMEEDAGKSTHSRSLCWVDLNRAGAPLIEIVSAPDLRCGADAAAYLRQLRRVLMALGVCDGNMEQGSFRCDVNVSIRRIGATQLGTRTEIKNVNSFRFMQRAIDFETARQARLLEQDEPVVQETRGWDERGGRTVPQRSKEQADDYRYFPEPDLPALLLDHLWIESLREEVVELPSDKQDRYVREFALTPAAASVLTSHPALSALFESVVALGSDPKRASGFIQTEILRDAQLGGLHARLPVTAEQLADIFALVVEGTISSKQAKDLYAAIRGTGEAAREAAEERGMHRVGDERRVRDVCQRVLSEHPAEVAAYRSGKLGLLGFFVGQVMRATKGSADPQLANRLLRELLACS